MLCDVIWGQPGCKTTCESPYDVIKQLRARSQEFADWLKFSQGGFHEIVGHENILTFGGRYLLCTGDLLT